MSEAPPPATQRSMGPKALVATLAVFTLIVGVPAALYWYSGQRNVALGLVGLFVLMVLVSAYALREVVKASRQDRP